MDRERLGASPISRPDVARRYEVSGQGATNALRTLEALGILEATTLRTSRGAQTYRAPLVLKALFSG